jgi:hypothetical protein
MVSELERCCVNVNVVRPPSKSGGPMPFAVYRFDISKKNFEEIKEALDAILCDIEERRLESPSWRNAYFEVRPFDHECMAIKVWGAYIATAYQDLEHKYKTSNPFRNALARGFKNKFLNIYLPPVEESQPPDDKKEPKNDSARK